MSAIPKQEPTMPNLPGYGLQHVPDDIDKEECPCSIDIEKSTMVCCDNAEDEIAQRNARKTRDHVGVGQG